MKKERRGVLNKRLGSAFERNIAKIFSNNFPEYKFIRTPNSKDFEYTDTLGDIVIPMNFPHRCIECRKRIRKNSLDFERFLNKFENTEFSKWIKECNEKFKGRKWLVIFKVGNGAIYILSKEKLKIDKYIFNKKIFVYSLLDYIEWLKKYLKENRNG